MERPILQMHGQYNSHPNAVAFESIFHTPLLQNHMRELLAHRKVGSFSVRPSQREVVLPLNGEKQSLAVIEQVILNAQQKKQRVAQLFFYDTHNGLFFKVEQPQPQGDLYVGDSFPSMEDLLVNLGAYEFVAHGHHKSTLVDYMNLEAGHVLDKL